MTAHITTLPMDVSTSSTLILATSSSSSPSSSSSISSKSSVSLSPSPTRLNSQPDTLDSRKRPRDFDTEHFPGTDTKRTNTKTADGVFYFKILVPSIASGAIIGKGGETIAHLQKETGTKVKMSKAADFYPGTTERVCLISGSITAIMEVVDFIMDRIREKPEIVLKNDSDNATGMLSMNSPVQSNGCGTVAAAAAPKLNQERDKQVKILVPNSTAGMIIGKSGNYIKQIKETSGSYVQISQKSNEISLQERCITVIGDKDGNKRACVMILEKIVEDPSSNLCLNLSYADVSGPVANYNPTGSPFANQASPASVGGMSPSVAAAAAAAAQSHMAAAAAAVAAAAAYPQFGTQNAALNSPFSYAAAAAAAAAATGNLTSYNTQNVPTNDLLHLNLNIVPPMQPPSHSTLAQLIDHIKLINLLLRSYGYSELAINEICTSLTTLAKFGLLGFNMSAGVAAAAASTPSQQQLPSSSQTTTATPLGLTNFLGISLDHQHSHSHHQPHPFLANSPSGIYGQASAAANASATNSISQLSIGPSHRTILDRIENQFEHSYRMNQSEVAAAVAAAAARAANTTEMKLIANHNTNGAATAAAAAAAAAAANLMAFNNSTSATTNNNNLNTLNQNTNSFAFGLNTNNDQHLQQSIDEHHQQLLEFQAITNTNTGTNANVIEYTKKRIFSTNAPSSNTATAATPTNTNNANRV